MNRILILSIAALSLVTACSATKATREPPWPKTTQVARTFDRVEPGPTSTSLWSSGSSLTKAFDDNRARRVGDLVTVTVVESSEASRTASTDLSHSSGVDVGVTAMLGMPKHLGLPDIYRGGGDFDPTVAANSANTFSGKGSTNRKESLKTSVSARVMEILDDGNMIIEGRRQVEVNDDIQYIYVRGIARPIDISPDNIISSRELAEAEIIYSGEGDLAAQQRPGWFYQILSAVWPF